MGKFYDSALYQNIILNNAKNAVKLCIVSGYGSAAFLGRVMAEFPKLNIDLYLGMTPQGISKRNHSGFKALMATYDNLNVFYQINEPVTHIKLLSFMYSDARIISFNGSANFTENGFFNWHESMSEAEIDSAAIFECQKMESKLCIDKSIELDINIYEDETLKLEDEIAEDDIQIEAGTIAEQSENKKAQSKFVVGSKKLHYGFEVPVLFENDKSKQAGINQKKPYLTASNNAPFTATFKPGEKIIFKTDEGNIFTAYVDERKSRRMYFEQDIKSYITKKLNISKDNLIEYSDLLRYGKQHLLLEDNGDKTYTIHF